VVLYTNAFRGARADVRLRCSAMGLEQDIVWREQPKLPDDWRVEDARLEVWTEWFDAPEPKREPQIVNLRESLTNVAPVLAADERLNFGSMKIVQGRAFTGDDRQGGVPVAKSWVRTGVLATRS
jgi:hypothetical protein